MISCVLHFYLTRGNSYSKHYLGARQCKRSEYDGGVGPCGAGTVYSRVSRWRGPMWCWDCIQQSMTVAWAHVVLGLYIAEYDGGVGPCGAGTVYSRV